MIVFIYGLIFLLFSSLASFYQLVISRREKGESWILGRSRCDYCQQPLNLRSLLPFFHYFLLSGKSFCCKEKLSIKPALFEFVAGLSSCLIVYRIGFGIESIYYITFYLFLYFLVLQDIGDQAIYNRDTLVIFFLILFSTLFFKGRIFLLPITFTGCIYTGIYFLARGGLGLGDVYFAIILSLATESVQEAFSIHLYSFLLASVYAIYLLGKKKASRTTKIPLLPFLWLGSFVHFFLIY